MESSRSTSCSLYSILVLVLFVQLSSGYNYYRNDNNERFEKIENKIEKIERKVNILTNELSPGAEPRNCPQYEDAPRGGALPPNFPKFLPLEASREVLPQDRLRVTLKFWLPSTISQRNWEWRNSDNWDELEEEVSNEVPNLRPGEWEAAVVVPFNLSSIVFSILYDIDRSALTFNLTSKTFDRQTCIPLPVFETEPSGDIAYEPGQDVIVQATVPPKHRPEDSHHEDYYTNARLQPYAVNLTTGELMGRSNIEDFVQDIGREEFMTSEKLTFRLDTSANQLSGYMQVQVEDAPRRSDLISKIQRVTTLIIRPSDQSGPFPSGYVTIVTQPWEELTEDGSVTLDCDRGNVYPMSCYVSCLAFGDDLRYLTLYEQTENGLVQLYAEEEHTVNLDTLKYIWVQLGPSYGTETRRFQCLAANAEDRVDRKNYVVIFFEKARIDIVQSKAVPLSDGSAMELTCVARGDPQFNMTIRLNGEIVVPDSVRVDGYEVTGVKVVNTSSDLWEASCEVNQPTASDYFNFDLSPPPPDMDWFDGLGEVNSSAPINITDPLARQIYEGFVVEESRRNNFSTSG